jgi:aryl-alcohol dehydrogenase-like predicted oxidoreductase
LNYRKINNTSLTFSSVSLGTWKYREGISDKQAWRKIFQTAFSQGVNYFDSSLSYDSGNAEKFLGSLWKDLPRQSVFLGTKCFFPTGPGPEDRGLSRKHIFKCVDLSLSHLNTDYIDLYQCHRWDVLVPIEETIEAMDALVSQGKIRYWGLGSATAAQMLEMNKMAEIASKSQPVSHQHVYNMFNRTVENEILESCRKTGMGLLVYSPLAQGVLTGKYSQGAIPEFSRASVDSDRQTMWDFQEEKLRIAEKIKELAGQMNVASSTLALAWCLRQNEVCTVITSASSVAQLQENLKASDCSLSFTDFQNLESVLARSNFN